MFSLLIIPRYFTIDVSTRLPQLWLWRRRDDGSGMDDWAAHWRPDNDATEDEHSSDAVRGGNRSHGHVFRLPSSNAARMSRSGVGWHHYAARVSSAFFPIVICRRNIK